LQKEKVVKASYIAAVSLVSVLGLAGCGHRAEVPVHTVQYYEQHPRALAKVLPYCGKNSHKFLSHQHRYARQVRNCTAAANAKYTIDFYGNPYAKKQPPAVTTSGGTLNNTTRALGGN